MASKYYQLRHSRSLPPSFSLPLAVALSLGEQGWWGGIWWAGGGGPCRHIWVQLDQGERESEKLGERRMRKRRMRKRRRSVRVFVVGGAQVSVFPAAFLRGSVFSPSFGFSQGPSGPSLLEKSQTHTRIDTHTRTHTHAPIHLPSIPHVRPSLFGQGSGVPEKLSQMCWSKGKTKQTDPHTHAHTHSQNLCERTTSTLHSHMIPCNRRSSHTHTHTHCRTHEQFHLWEEPKYQLQPENKFAKRWKKIDRNIFYLIEVDSLNHWRHAFFYTVCVCVSMCPYPGSHHKGRAEANLDMCYLFVILTLL